MTLEALRPTAGADLRQLHRMIQEKGWQAALPGSLPENLLLALARDLRVLEVNGNLGGHSSKLASLLFAAAYLMTDAPGGGLRKAHEFHLSAGSLNKTVQAYQSLLEREIVTRITGYSFGPDAQNQLAGGESLAAG